MSINKTTVTSKDIASVSKDEVGNHARKGVKWNVIQVVARNILSLGTTAVLSRILSPSDFGLVGMVATLTALLMAFSDMGLSWATIQRKNISRIQVSNLFWLNVGIGAILWSICWLSSPWVANFYGEQALVAITTALGTGFILSGLAAQPIALLNRKMEYKTIAKIEVFSITIGALSALTAALSGLGYWALVIHSLGTGIVRFLLAIPMSRIQITFPRQGFGTLGLLTFGGMLAVSDFLLYAARNLDSVLIGKYWGTAELGFYNRAYFLMWLPSLLATGILTNLVVPSLSVLQDDINRFGNAYRKSLCMVAFIACPMALGLTLTANEMVYLIYGEQWQPVIPMLVWLSIASITEPIYKTTSWLFTAAGKAKTYLLMTFLSGVVLSIVFYLSIPYGALGMSKSYGITMGLAIVFPALWLAHKSAGLSFLKSIKVLWPIVICLTGMTFTVVGIEKLTSSWQLSIYSTLAIKVFFGMVSYIAIANLLMKEMIVNEFYSIIRRR